MNRKISADFQICISVPLTKTDHKKMFPVSVENSVKIKFLKDVLEILESHQLNRFSTETLLFGKVPQRPASVLKTDCTRYALLGSSQKF